MKWLENKQRIPKWIQKCKVDGTCNPRDKADNRKKLWNTASKSNLLFIDFKQALNEMKVAKI